MRSSMPDPDTYPERPKSTRKKWHAVIIVIIVIVSSFGVISLLHPQNKIPDISIDTAQNYLHAGRSYTMLLKTNEPYKNLTIYWGDGSNTTLKYTQDAISISHIYNSPGIYYIHYGADFKSGNINFNTYIPVYVDNSGVNNRSANGIITILNTSSPPVIPNSNIFKGNTIVNLSIGNSSIPSNSTFKIHNQTLSVYRNGSLNRTLFPGNNDSLIVNTGYYILNLSTITRNSTGTNYTTHYYMDIPVNPHAKLYINTVADSLVMDSLTPYANLNPQEAYTTSELQILDNIEETLVGNSSSGYFPEIASSLPTSNSNNYTFNISSHVLLENGKPVTAYDVYYSLVMDLLLENKEPQTPGWLLAQYLLPGNYHDTNNYTNIKNAITYNNLTQTVTLNFTTKLSPDTVYSILSSPGTFISSSSYLSSHGENLTWTAHGFRAFENSNKTYVMAGAISDGPYEIQSSSPGIYITLTKNPYFSGNANNSIPAVTSITIDYINDFSSVYQDLRFNTSQLAVFPDTYDTYLTSYLTTVRPYGISYNASAIYNFNSNVNETILSKYVGKVNFPDNLFSNLTVREAFWHAYPGPGYKPALAQKLWYSFIDNSTMDKKFNIIPLSKYKNNSLVIPIFTTSSVASSNLSVFVTNLKNMIGNGSSFPIITESASFFNAYESSGLNPMPIYETTVAENMNLSTYYSYLGNTMNYTHAFNNGFSNYSFAINDKNQSIIMNQLNANLSKLALNYNNTNLNETKLLLNSLYLYINTPRDVGLKLYMQNYIIAGNGVFNSQGIVLFNKLVI